MNVCCIISFCVCVCACACMRVSACERERARTLYISAVPQQYL